MNDEIWQDIPDWSGYQVSNLGRVKSLSRLKNYGKVRAMSKEIILKHCVSGSRYCYVNLSNGVSQKIFPVHRLVANAFLVNPENKRTVNHKDGIKTNNRVSNLEWMTHSENHLHAYRNNIRKKPQPPMGINSKYSKSVVQILSNGDKVKWDCVSDITRKLGYSQGNISSVCRGIRPFAYGCKWEYSK